MGRVRKVFSFIVKTQLIISLGGGFYYLIGHTMLQEKFIFQPTRFLLILSGTWLTYATYRRILSIKKRLWITLVLYTTYLCLLFIYLPVLETAFLLHLALLSFFYDPVSFIPGRLFSLRKVPLLKLVILSYIWASIASFYPALFLNISIFNREVSTLFWIQFCFIMSITIPFDIRDFYLDLKDNLITVPRIFGFKNAKRIATFFLVVFAILLLDYKIEILSVGILVVLALWLIWRSDRRRSNIYYGFWLDGLIILYFLLVYIHFNAQALIRLIS